MDKESLLDGFTRQLVGMSFAEFVPILKIMAIIYIICFIYFIIQKIRKKCYFDYDIVDLGCMDLYLLWGISSPIGFFVHIRNAPTYPKGPLWTFIGAVIFFLLMLLLASKPLHFLIENIKKYGFSGILYWIALVGFGFFGIIFLAIQALIVALPLMLFMAVLIAVAACDRDRRYYYDDDDYWKM